MKSFRLFMLLLIGTPIVTSAQTDAQNKKVETDAEPRFPKGDQVLYALILNDLEYSKEAKAAYAEGEVSVSFDVLPDSTVSNIQVISGVGYGIDDAVKKRLAGFKFAPGVQNGMAVRMNTMYSFPVKAH